jgi:penicillin-binding protein 2
MLNRALNGLYAPGSTFKTITALAALESGYQSGTIYDCEGVFRLGTMRLRCWGGIPHGPLTLESAIEKSCNAFFCHLGHEIGYEHIRKCAAQAGLGSKTGVDMPYERAGSLPDPMWKRRHRNQTWTPGDTCQTSIGQGMLLATPLQMANVCAAIANGGRLLKPHLHIETLRAWDAWSCSRRSGTPIGWKRENLDLVRRGMQAVVDSGTGKRAAVRGLTVAAKTGTAEFDVRGKRKKNTWVIAFAPCDREASIALAIVVENGDSGGKTAAPLAHDVLVSAFGEAPASGSEVEP